ncbi:MAG: glycosyltransferase [Proteobacteria bacterium]|nr:glycosyltransferase [Pseudomonadota bacterium]NOG59108.1 glycosyltransferase [Pseudomonadota bacterium]
MKTLLILDMSFTLKMFKQRQLEQALESRKLDGYFSQVISVHPLAGLFETGDDRYGKPVITWLDDAHVFIEGKVGVCRLLRFMSPVNLLCAQIGLIKLLVKMNKDIQVDVVRIGDPYYLGLMGWFLSKLLHVPLVIRVCFNYDQLHSTTGKAVFPRLLGFRFVEKVIERFVFPRCSLVAGANQNNLDYAISNGASPDLGVVFRYGNLIYPLHFTEPESRGDYTHLLNEIGVQGEFLTTVSRLEKMKQPEQNLLVMKSLVDAGYDISFVFIGDGSMKTELEEMVNELGLKGRVYFAGNRPQEWIAKVLPGARLVLSPHMGRGLTEACLAGAPIVAYDFDWQGEIIRTGETGELVMEGDWNEMAIRAKKILDNPCLSKQYGENARSVAVKMMSPKKLIDLEVASYEELFNRV